MSAVLGDWHEFFVILGGGAAVLTGLVFVAMSLHLRAIADSVPQRGRARATLTGLIGVFVACVFGVIPGQDSRTFGIELCGTAAVLGLWNAIAVLDIRAFLRRHPSQALPGYRLRSAIYGAQAFALALSGTLLLVDEPRALAVLAAVLIFVTIFMVVNSWALLLDVTEREPRSR